MFSADCKISSGLSFNTNIDKGNTKTNPKKPTIIQASCQLKFIVIKVKSGTKNKLPIYPPAITAPIATPRRFLNHFDSNIPIGPPVPVAKEIRKP